MTFMTDHLGAYVGPATRGEVLDALEGHSLGELVVGVELPDGAMIAQIFGHCNACDNRDGADRDAVRLAQGPGTSASLWVPHAPCEFERWTEGLRFLLPGGVTVTVILWEGILHVTSTGDVAPGFGPVDVRLDFP